MKVNQLARIIEELIETMHLQATELEKLLIHIQQVTPRMGYTSEIPAVAAEMTKLRLEMKKLLKEDKATEPRPSGGASASD